MRMRSARRSAIPLALAALAGLGVPASALGTAPLGQQETISEGVGRDSSIAANTTKGGSLAVWVTDDSAIVARVLDRDGDPITPSTTLSALQTGAQSRANRPDVAYNAKSNDYLVVWQRDTDAGPGEQLRVRGRRVSAAGAPVGPVNDISRAAPAQAQRPAVAYNGALDEYLVAYQQSGVAPVADDLEIYVQRVGADGAPLPLPDSRISDMGPSGVADFGAARPEIAYNPDRNEYVVVWDGDQVVNDEREVYAQVLTADGTETGTDDLRLSTAGPADDADFDAIEPAVGYSELMKQYLVAWDAREPIGAETEIQVYGQRLSSTGAPVGVPEFLISEAGRDGVGDRRAVEPEVAASTTSAEFLIVWTDGSNTNNLFGERRDAGGSLLGPSDVTISTKPPDDTSSPSDLTYSPVNGRYTAVWTYAEPGGGDVIDRRQIASAAPAITTAGDVCAPPPAPRPTSGKGRLALTLAQLRINQRIGSAGLRRLEAVEAWLNAGIEARDICGGAIGPEKLAPGIIAIPQPTSIAALQPPNPRPVTPRAATPKRNVTFTLSRAQLLINQRIYQALIRRAAALKSRLDGGLSGGDVRDGAIGQPQLHDRLAIAGTSSAPPAAPTTTEIATPGPRSPGAVTLSLNQLGINQRVAQGGVRRANALIDRLTPGLTGSDLRDGTIGSSDLAPGVAG